MKDLAERVGKTAQQIAQEADVAKSTVDNWNQLKYAPRMTAAGFARLMQVYECTFEELVQADEECTKSIEAQKIAGIGPE